MRRVLRSCDLRLGDRLLPEKEAGRGGYCGEIHERTSGHERMLAGLAVTLAPVPRNMYFLGVTTAQSSIHRIFPRWTQLAGVENAVLQGIDITVDAPPMQYRAAVQTILDDPEAEGGLVTTHKVGVFNNARDLFTDFD